MTPCVKHNTYGEHKSKKRDTWQNAIIVDIYVDFVFRIGLFENISNVKEVFLGQMYAELSLADCLWHARISFRLVHGGNDMKLLRSMALAFTLLCPYLLLSQTPLQEISRITYPNNCNFIPNIIANGDINGDGHPDLIYSVVDNNIAGGGYAQIYIYHNIPDSTTQPDQILTPPSNLYGWYGFAVSYGGDLNGDGIDDLVVGSSNYDIWATGAVSIYYGGTTLSSQPDLTLFGSDYDDFDDTCLRFGQRVLTDCDLNGDGYDDLVVNGDGPQDYWFGHVWAFLGGQQLNTTCAFNKRGTQWYEDFGEGLATGDINGDGKDDIILTRKINIVDQDHFDYALDIFAGGDSLSSVPAYESIISNNNNGIVRILANGDLNGDGYDDIIYILYTSSETNFNVIYGQGNLNFLTVQSYNFPPYVYKKLLCYCNMNYDLYSDFCMFQLSMTEGGAEYGNFLVFKQTNSTLDLNYNFFNSGETVASIYGQGYFLGDMNCDSYPEFFIFTHDSSINNLPNYASILTEQYVGNDDEVMPLPRDNISIYPNPFRDKVNIAFNNKKHNACYNVNVYDIKGRRVFTQQGIRSDKFIWNQDSNLSNKLSNGIYLVTISENNRIIKTSKLMHIK